MIEIINQVFKKINNNISKTTQAKQPNLYQILVRDCDVITFTKMSL